jgi:membrane protease YdiL (CAAX protease family)
MPELIPADKILAGLLTLLIFGSIIAAWIGLILRLALNLPVLPARTPRYVPWGIGSVVLSILTWLGLQILVPTCYFVFVHPRPAVAVPVVARVELSPGEQMGLSAVGNAFVLILIPFLLILTCKARPRDFGFVAKNLPKQIVQGFLAYFLIAPIVIVVMLCSLLIWNKTNHPLEEAIKRDHTPGMLVVLVLAGVVLAPLAEELIFRGVLLGWLTRMVLGRPKKSTIDDFSGEPELSSLLEPDLTAEPGFAEVLDHDPDNPYAPPRAPIALQETTEVSVEMSGSKTFLLILSNVVISVVFAGLHASVWPTPVPIFFLSLGLGFLYQRTGSLVPSTALHMTFNGVSTLLMLLTLGGPAPKGKEAPNPADPLKIEAKPAALNGHMNFNLFPKRNH